MPCPTTTIRAISAQRSETSVRGLEGGACDRARGFRRPEFRRADVACGALAPRSGARAAPCRRHRRSRLAAGGRARGARRQASGPQRSTCRIARCAGPVPSRKPDCRPRRGPSAIACWRKAAQGERRHPYPHRAYPRRPGRDAVDADVARQRHRRSGGDGARSPSAMACGWRGRCCDVPKSRLIATLKKAKIGFADDPTNRDMQLHAAAAARADAGAGGRGRRHPESGAAGGAAGARQCRGGSAGRRRRALSCA